MSDINY